MDEQKIVYLYCEKKYTLRMIAEELGTNHHRVKRILDKHGIEITSKGRVRKPFTEEHKKKISESCKGREAWCKGKKMPKSSLYLNMKNHLKWNVSIEFLKQFEDIDRLKTLNLILTRDRVSKHFDERKYMEFISRFYDDPKFVKQFNEFKKTGNKYDKPSLDHIIPLSRGGEWEIGNLQIVSWFENRAKCDMTQGEFDKMINKYFIEKS